MSQNLKTSRMSFVQQPACCSLEKHTRPNPCESGNKQTSNRNESMSVQCDSMAQRPLGQLIQSLRRNTLHISLRLNPFGILWTNFGDNPFFRMPLGPFRNPIGSFELPLVHPWLSSTPLKCTRRCFGCLSLSVAPFPSMALPFDSHSLSFENPYICAREPGLPCAIVCI